MDGIDNEVFAEDREGDAGLDALYIGKVAPEEPLIGEAGDGSRAGVEVLLGDVFGFEGVVGVLGADEARAGGLAFDLGDDGGGEGEGVAGDGGEEVAGGLFLGDLGFEFGEGGAGFEGLDLGALVLNDRSEGFGSGRGVGHGWGLLAGWGSRLWGSLAGSGDTEGMIVQIRQSAGQAAEKFFGGVVPLGRNLGWLARSVVWCLVVAVAMVVALSGRVAVAQPVTQAPPSTAPAVDGGGGAGAQIEASKKILDRGVEQTKDVAAQAQDALKNEPWLWGNVIGAVVVLIALFAADVIRPGSFEKAGVRDVKAHPWTLWLFCALIVWGAQVMGTASASALIGAKYMGEAGSAQFQVMQGGLGLVAGLLVGVSMIALVKASSPNGGFGFDTRGVTWGLAGIVMAWPVITSAGFGFNVLHTKVFNGTAEKLAHPTLELIFGKARSGNLDAWSWGLLFIAAVGAPILEEIVYRGFLQTAFLKVTGKPWVAILLTSAAFAGMHLLPGTALPWYAAATVGVLGLCMGIAYERTKNLAAPMLMHALFNMVNIGIAYYGMAGK